MNGFLTNACIVLIFYHLQKLNFDADNALKVEFFRFWKAI